MSFRVGTRDQRTGDVRAHAQGDGPGGRTLRTGSAMVLIQYVSGLLMVLCLVVVWVTVTANGVLLLATVFAATFLWSCGVFSRRS